MHRGTGHRPSLYAGLWRRDRGSRRQRCALPANLRTNFRARHTRCGRRRRGGCGGCGGDRGAVARCGGRAAHGGHRSGATASIVASGLRVSPWVSLILSYLIEIDKIVGFHDVTRLTTLRNSAMPGSLTPRHKGTVYWRSYLIYLLSYLIGGVRFARCFYPQVRAAFQISQSTSI
jgi:hypothetical protein